MYWIYKTVHISLLKHVGKAPYVLFSNDWLSQKILATHSVKYFIIVTDNLTLTASLNKP
jgi:hypothetical protein